MAMEQVTIDTRLWHRTRILPKCTACKKYLLFPYNTDELTCLNCGITVRYLTSDYAEKVYNKVQDIVKHYQSKNGGELDEGQEKQEGQEINKEKITGKEISNAVRKL